MTTDEMIDAIVDADAMCDICKYAYDCSGPGVTGGPNGPLYPPCMEGDDWIDEDKVADVYSNLFEETKGVLDMFFDEKDLLWAAIHTLQDSMEWAFDAEGSDFSNYCMGVIDLVSELTKKEEQPKPTQSESIDVDPPAYA